jgi:nucleoside-diphosphate-sugar epimerase
MKTLVTGGAGYVGVLLTEALLDQGHDVTVVDKFVFGYEPILYLIDRPNLKIVKCDVRDDDFSYLDGHEVIFHLAGISGYPAAEANPKSAQLINVDATKRISNHLSKDQFLIYASTTSLYGREDGVSTEDTEIHPSGSLYASTKYEGEKYVMEREKSISLRWATVFGISPRMRAGLLLNDFVEKAVHERALVIYSGKSKRTFMHVRDSVKGYLFALENVGKMQGQIFNMGSKKLNYSKLDLARMIEEHVDFDILESQLDDIDERDFVISFEKVAALGYDCNISVHDGIKELVKLYRFYDPTSFIRPI